MSDIKKKKKKKKEREHTHPSYKHCKKIFKKAKKKQLTVWRYI